MKKLVLIALISVTGFGLYAQSLGIGGRLGFTTATILADDEDYLENIGFRSGVHIDVYGYKMFTKNIGIEASVSFLQAGATYDAGGFGSVETRLNYLAVPVSARFKWGYFTLNPGIAPAFLISAKTEDDDDTDGYNKFHASFFVAPGLEFPVGISIRSTINIGLTDVFKTNDDFDVASRNFIFQLSVGYTFFKKAE